MVKFTVVVKVFWWVQDFDIIEDSFLVEGPSQIGIPIIWGWLYNFSAIYEKCGLTTGIGGYCYKWGREWAVHCSQIILAWTQ